MTLDSNGSIHDDTTGRFTGAVQHEGDAAEVLPPVPAWHSELIELGFNPGLDSVKVAASQVLDFEVIVHDDQLVTLTRKRVRGDQVEFAYWKGDFGHFTVPASTELTVVRIRLPERPRLCTCGAHEYSGCFCNLTAGEFMASPQARHL